MDDLALTLLARVRVGIGEPFDVGRVPEGRRRVIPIASGVVEGDAISGEVVPLGADWNLARTDGSDRLAPDEAPTAPGPGEPGRTRDAFAAA